MQNYITNLIGDPFWVVTVPLGIAGWCIAFVGAIINTLQDEKMFPILTWWGLAFQFLVTALLTYAVIHNRIHMYRLALLSFLPLATIYSTNTTNNFVWRSTPSCSTVAAGQILVSIVNLLWMFFIGTTHDEPLHAYVASRAAAKYPSDFRRPGRHYGETSRGSGTLGRPNDRYSRGSTGAVPQHIGSYQQPYGMEPYGSEPFSGEHHRAAGYDGLQDQSYAYGYDIRDRASNSRLSGLSASTDQSESLRVPTEYPYKARALYSYSANPDDGNEISFEKDEVLDISDITGRWWQARRQNGEVGICPSNYVVLQGSTFD